MSAQYPQNGINEATQAALDLKAPKSNPVFTGGLNVDGLLDTLFSVTEDVIAPFVPFIEQPITIGDSGDTVLTVKNTVVYYNRSDAQAIVVPPVSSVFGGQSLVISNNIASPVDLTAIAPGSFFNGTLGVVDSVNMAGKETIKLTVFGDQWRVVARYTSVSGGSGDVVGPTGAVNGNVAVFDGTTGKLIKDSGAVALEGVATSSGPADAGKVTLLNEDGVLDPTFFAGGSADLLSTLIAAEISITGATTATLSRMHVGSGTTTDYTVTLPAAAGNAAHFMGFRMAAGLTKIVTVGTFKLWANESLFVISDGANWIRIYGNKIPMLAAMCKNTNTVVPDVTVTALTLNETLVDNTGRMANLGSNRIDIQRTGNYTVIGQVTNTGGGTIPLVQIRITKNGSAVAIIGSTLTNDIGSQYVVILPLTAGDYLTLETYQSSGGSKTYFGASGYSQSIIASELP